MLLLKSAYLYKKNSLLNSNKAEVLFYIVKYFSARSQFTWFKISKIFLVLQKIKKLKYFLLIQIFLKINYSYFFVNCSILTLAMAAQKQFNTNPFYYDYPALLFWRHWRLFKSPNVTEDYLFWQGKLSHISLI